ALGRSVSLSLDVGAVAHQQEYAFLRCRSQARDVELLAVDRREVELEIASVHKCSDRRADDQTERIGNRVRAANKLDCEAANLYLLPRADLAHDRSIFEPELFEFPLQKSERQCRTVDHWYRQLFEDKWNSTYMIFMTVRDCQSADLVLVFDQK